MGKGRLRTPILLMALLGACQPLGLQSSRAVEAAASGHGGGGQRIPASEPTENIDALTESYSRSRNLFQKWIENKADLKEGSEKGWKADYYKKVYDMVDNYPRLMGENGFNPLGGLCTNFTMKRKRPSGPRSS